jgi:hypothetical protein
VGIIGLALVLWPVARILTKRAAWRAGESLPFAALLVGAVAAAAFAAPTDGHWELGLLTALIPISSRGKRTGAPA